MQPTTPSLARMHARLAVLDGMLVVGSFATWSLTGSLDMVVHAIGTIVRMLALQLHLWWLLAPLRRWLSAGPNSDAATLRAADACLQGLTAKLMLVYPLGWLVVQVVDLVAVRVAPRPGLVFADAELVTFVLICLAAAVICVALPVVAVPYMTREIGPRVSKALHGARLEASRPVSSFAWQLRVFIGAVCAAVAIGTMAAGGKTRVDGLREAAVADAMLDASLSAASGEPAPLPDLLAARDDAATATVLGAFDPTRNRAVAAARRLDGSTWVVRESVVDERIGLFALVTVVFGTLLSAIAAMAATFMLESIRAPIVRLREVSRRVASSGELGELDRVAPTHNDELGGLIADFNAMLDMFEELGAAARAVAHGRLTTQLERPGEVHDAFRAMAEQLRTIVEQLRSTALDVGSAAAEIEASTAVREHAAAEQREVVEQASVTVHTLADAATSIDDMAARVRDDAERSLATTHEMRTKIAELARVAVGIGDLLEQIREIADRSDLLALNGSLEATRAGEAGRGFALVAAEMRRLAERVTTLVADVRAQISTIEAAGAQAVAATEHGRELSERTAAAARSISSVTTKQRQGTVEATAATEAMAAFVLAAATEASQTRAAAQGLREQVRELERLMQRFE